MLNKNPYCDPDKKYIVYDCESCHLNLAIENYPWQNAWLVCQGNRILEEYNYYINWPKMKVSEDAAKTCHFNYDFVARNSQEPKFVLEKLNEYLYNPEYFTVISNGLRFDCFVIMQFQKEMGMKVDWSWLDRLLDTVALVKGVKLNIKKSSEDSLLQYQFRLHNLKSKGVKTGLAALCKENGINYDVNIAHNALSDCKYLFEVWNKIKWNIEL